MRSGGLELGIRTLRGKCMRPLGEPCLCFRPAGHGGFCECHCTIYGHAHGEDAETVLDLTLPTDGDWKLRAE
jgi:hypothetical protein